MEEMISRLLSRAATLLRGSSTNALEDWLTAFTVLVLFLAVTALSQKILKKIHGNRNWRVINELAPTGFKLLYAAGIFLFFELTPLQGRLRLWLDSGVYFLTLFFFLRLVYRSAILGLDWSVKQNLNASVLQQGFVPLVKNLITIFVFIMGIIMVLRHYNEDVMSLVTALGVSSLAVGLAAKDTVSNMIAGFILIIDRNLMPGDRITLSDQTGDVNEIGLRSTQIRLPNGTTLVVPNSELANTKILNLSRPIRPVTCVSQVRVPFQVSFDRARGHCEKASQAIAEILKEKLILFQLISLADGHQLIQITFWVPEHSRTNAVLSEFNQRLLENFKADGISPVGPISLNFPN